MTHEESTLLRAIVLAPDDLTLRLIYADWCEEQGRLPRATFIRAQCLLDPLLIPSIPPESHGFNPRFPHVASIAPQVRRDLLVPFQPLADSLGWDLNFPEASEPDRSVSLWIRRGFGERLALRGLWELSIWVQHAAKIMERTPLLSLALLRGPGIGSRGTIPVELLQSLLELEGTKRFHTLDLSIYAIDAAAVRFLLDVGAERLVQQFSFGVRNIPDDLHESLLAQFGDVFRMHYAPLDEDIPF